MYGVERVECELTIEISGLSLTKKITYAKINDPIILMTLLIFYSNLHINYIN